MRCNDIEVLLATRRDLTVAQEQSVRSHVADCERCAALLRREERTDRVLRSLPSVNATPPARVRDSLQTTIGRRRSRFGWVPILAVGLASLLVMFGIAFAVQGVRPVTSTTDDPQSPAGSIVDRIEGAPQRMLAYIQDGDVWIKPLPDGEPRQITDDGNNTAPQWSASGRWLLYRKASSGEAWIVRSDGGAKQPINDGNGVRFATWSPTEDVIAYSGGGGLNVVAVDDGIVKSLVDGSASPMSGPFINRFVWSPDGKHLAFDCFGIAFDHFAIRPEEIESGNWFMGLWQIAIDNPQSVTELYRLANPSVLGMDGQAMSVTNWTGDGASVLFLQTESAEQTGSSAALYAIAAEGGEPRLVSSAMLVSPDRVSNSPDGALLALVESTAESETSGKHISLANVRSGELRQLTGDDMAALGPEWSPNGERIAFYAGPNEGDPALRRIWTMRADGSDKRQITSDAAFRDEHPHWLDDRYLIIGRTGTRQEPSLWLLDSVTGKIMQVVDRVSLPANTSADYVAPPWNDLFDVSTAPTTIVAEPVPDEAPPAATEMAQIVPRDSLYIARQREASAGLDMSKVEITAVDPLAENTIATWDGFDDMVITRDGSQMYAASPTQIAAIDTVTQTELWRTDVADQMQWLYPGPSRLALSPNERTLYVISYNSSDSTQPFWLQEIDTATGQVQPSTITLPDCPAPQIATASSGDRIYMVCANGNGPLILNTTTRELTPLFTDYDTGPATYYTPALGATSAALSSDGQTLFLTEGIGTVWSLDVDRPNEFVRSDWPWGDDKAVSSDGMLAVSGNGARIVVARTVGDDPNAPNATEFRVLDAGSLEEVSGFRLEQPIGAYTLVMNHDGSRLYAATSDFEHEEPALLEINTGNGQVIAEQPHADQIIMRMLIQP